jgi:hypothetical protein
MTPKTKAPAAKKSAAPVATKAPPAPAPKKSKPPTNPFVAQNPGPVGRSASGAPRGGSQRGR